MSSNEGLTEKPGYYAIIPASVRYDKKLSPNAKLLYSEITALLNFRNKCFASNAYFGKLYDISEVQVSRLIKQLIDAGHIVTEMENTSKGSQRLIKLAININDNTPLNKNDYTGINKNDKDNKQTTNNNSLFNNNEGISLKRFKAPTIEEVEEYFRLLKKPENSEKFFNFYTSNGWMVGRVKMKDWKAAAKNWVIKHEEEVKAAFDKASQNGKPKQSIVSSFISKHS